MSYSCPLNFVQMDAYASRIGSFMVSSLIMLYLFTSVEYILYFLLIDFFMKLFVDRKYSLIARTALVLRKVLGFEENFVDGGAKRLAAYFGLVFVLLLIASHFIGSLALIYAVGGVFVSCALLDVAIDYCLGCHVYHIIKKIYPSFMSS